MFEDRSHAGRLLADRLSSGRITASIVLAIPRGGVPVAAEIAERLGMPLDVILVRKLGLPFQPEVAMGAVGEGDVRIVDVDLALRAGVTAAELSEVERREREVLEHRRMTLRGERPRRDLTGQDVLVVDDGIATGATAEAACKVARRLGAAHVIVAAPVGAREALDRIPDADRIVCLEMPAVFRAVGNHYRHFAQTTDAEVMRLLRRADGSDPGLIRRGRR